MNRLRTLLFMMISFAAVTIGANNRSRFDSGQMPLDNRSEYCEWITDLSSGSSRDEQYQASSHNGVLFPTISEEVYDHIWELSHRLSQYRSRKVNFENVPNIIREEIDRLKSNKQQEIENINQSIAMLESNAENYKSTSSTDKDLTEIAEHKSKNEIPRQIQLLTNERSLLEKELSDLASLRFSDWGMNAVMQSAARRNNKSNISRLDVELKLAQDGLKKKIEIYPVWVNAKGEVSRASKDSYFEISGSMVTEEILTAITSGQLPPSFLAYQKFTEVPLQTGEYTIDWPQSTDKKMADITFKAKTTVRIAGGDFSNRGTPDPGRVSADIFTSASNLAVDAFLDLGCLKQSRWAKTVISRTENLINDPESAKRFHHSKIDERALTTLTLLKSMNGKDTQATPEKDRQVAGRRENHL